MTRPSQAPPHDEARPTPVGTAIRQRRQRLGMTLKNLATASGLSVPFLSQVERDQAMPSLVSLAQIAAALDVETGYFIGTPAPGQIVRRAHAPEALHVGTSPVDYVRLSGSHAERRMEALLITMPPGQGSPLSHREGEGFWYVLDGALEVWVGRDHFTLNAGDSTHFEQRHPYRMRNDGTMPVRVLWVGTPALL
ncbi:XRE family transcriptional regulator [Luteibacter sp. PPL552]